MPRPDDNHIEGNRSEAVQELLGRMPSWTLRWGISLVFVLLLLLLGGSWYIRYPEVLTAPVTLSSDNPSELLVAPANGRLTQLWVQDGDSVEAGDWLALLENAALTEDVRDLEEQLAVWAALSPADSLYWLMMWEDRVLGDMQNAYRDFQKTHLDYRLFREGQYYQQKVKALQEKGRMYRLYYNRQWQQRQAIEEQVQLARQRLSADSILLQQTVIAPLAYKERKEVYLQKKHSFHAARSALAQTGIAMENVRESLAELELEQQIKGREKQANLEQAYQALLNQYRIWQQQYLLKTSINGQLSFHFLLSERQPLMSGQPIVSINSSYHQGITGKAFLPPERSAKVKSGQKVMVRLDGYPYEEYGYLVGRVKGMALLPTSLPDGKIAYLTEITFPQASLTSYRQRLKLGEQMSGTAEIITEDQRLLEKILFQFRRLRNPD